MRSGLPRRSCAAILRLCPACIFTQSYAPSKQTVEQTRRLIRTLFLATTVVLLIVCANLAGLMLVRSIRRRRQITLQLALGAPAGTLLREAVLESLLLSMTGGLLGVGLAGIACGWA